MILIIDDERRYMDSYIMELELSNFELSFQKDIKKAWGFLIENQNQIELIILDIMMPYESMFKDEEVQYGLRTGRNFYKKIREIMADVPVIVLTNVSDDNIRNWFANQPETVVLRKEDILPFELVTVIKGVLHSSEKVR